MLHADGRLMDTLPLHRDPELKKKEALAQLGVYYGDDYDYMQHLRETGASDAERVQVDESAMQSILTQLSGDGSSAAEGGAEGGVDLRSLLPADVMAPRDDELFDSAPSLDPRFDMDPDIVSMACLVGDEA